MSDAVSAAKTPVLCRYFASTGSCFYEQECQFSHENPGTGPDGVGIVKKSSPSKDSAPIARDLQGMV